MLIYSTELVAIIFELIFLFEKYCVKSTKAESSVDETKLTLKNAFILDLFVVGGEKKSKYNERTLFWSSVQKLDLSVNPHPPKDTYTRFSGLI